jgi:putative membrane protein
VARTWLFGLLASVLLLMGDFASAQQGRLDANGFLRLAASLAAFEIEAGSHALQAATRPEVAALARETVEFQGNLMQRLRTVAQQRNLNMPEEMLLEHRAALDGLVPLDGEELNRRYAETQIQALQQAVELYRAAAGQDDDPALKGLAAELLPGLERQQAMAQELVKAVRP